MKKLILSLVAIATISLSSFGQAPEGFKYQAVVRDAGNLILNNQAVGMQLTIQQGSIGGTAVYTETFATTTNAYGLVNLEIGSGTTTDDFTLIDWSTGPYFMETSADVTGGTSYAVMGTSQLMSVPYALYAKTSGNGQGPVGPQGPAGNDGVDGQGGVTQAGTGINITGTGTVVDPYIVNDEGCNLSIGDTLQGGIIFYLDASGCHGLVCSLTNPSTAVAWSNGLSITNASREGTKAGLFNTERIVINQGSGAYAAQLCANFLGGNYGDWYLPSLSELNIMYANRAIIDASAISNGGAILYNGANWSSTEDGSSNAWRVDFNVGNNISYLKTQTDVAIRAVRAF